MLLLAVVLAGVSLLVLPRGVGYDPQSWLIWGREIGHLDLDTRHAATAVKPLPIFVDILLAPAGSAAPVLWLLVARAGTLLSLMLAFRLAHRIGGMVAGIAATVGLVPSSGQPRAAGPPPADRSEGTGGNDRARAAGRLEIPSKPPALAGADPRGGGCGGRPVGRS